MTALYPANPAESLQFRRLEPGFSDPVRDAQACFRAVLDAMARPGQIVQLPGLVPGGSPLSPAAWSIALTLCDIDTPVWLDEAAATAAGQFAFHCGAPLAITPADARFAFIADALALPPLDGFALGTEEYPERSATLVIDVGELTDDTGVRLRGPGIYDDLRLGVSGLPPRFWTERVALSELFPRGIDVLFVDGGGLAALPRSTQIIL
jgi:alpha-D-ribose 1-methylphosphonate 5-triphosphate synthase subunit PhnH